MDRINKTFAYNIKTLRESRNMTLRQLECETGISKTALCYYENCKRDPSLTAAKILADYYGVTIEALINELFVEENQKKSHNKNYVE